MQTNLGSFIHNLIDSRYSFANLALFIFIKSHRVKERIDNYILRPPFDSDHPHRFMPCRHAMSRVSASFRVGTQRKPGKRRVESFFTECRTNASIWLKLGNLKSAGKKMKKAPSH